MMKKRWMLSLTLSSLALSTNACSWIIPTRIVDDKTSAQIECRMDPAGIDTVFALGELAVATLLFTAAGGPSSCDHNSDDGLGCALAEGYGAAAAFGTGLVFLVAGLVQGSSGMTGWSKYSKCRAEKQALKGGDSALTWNTWSSVRLR